MFSLVGRNNAAEADIVLAKARVEAAAKRRKHFLGARSGPGAAAKHAPARVGVPVGILAPFPDVAAEIAESSSIGREARHRAGARERVLIGRDDGPVGGCARARFRTGVVAGRRRRRKSASPWVSALYFATALLGRRADFNLQAD